MKYSRFLLVFLSMLVVSWSLAEHTGETLRLAITQDEGTLTPYSYQTGYPGYELMTLIYDTLYLNDENYLPQPWLGCVDIPPTVNVRKGHGNGKAAQ